MADETLRIGVWQSRGKIYRRDSEKEPYPVIYTPKRENDIRTVLSLARQLHSGVVGGSFWGTQGEKFQDDLVKQLRKKIRP